MWNKKLLFHLGLLWVLVQGWSAVEAAPLKYTEDRLPSSLNPLFADDMYSVRITELIFEGLVGWDEQQQPAPQLAVSWEIDPKKMWIVFNLREGVTWHDGKPFTAKDVAFTIEAMTSRRSQISDRYLAQIIKKVKVISPHKIKIFFRRPMSAPLRWFHFKIIPLHKFMKGGRKELPRRGAYFSQKPYGTGPFRFVRWRGRKIVLKRYKGHWRKKIRLSGVSLQVNPDKNIQREVLRYGGFDAIIRVRPKDIPLLERDRNIRLYPYSTNDWWYIGINHKNRILRDLRVREALLYALDRDSLRMAHLGDGQTISGPFSPNDPLYNFDVEPRSQDLEKAAQLLNEAGWKKHPSKPYRTKRGKILAFKLLISKSRSSYKSLCLALQSEWRQIGVKVDLVWLDDAQWNKTVMREKKFDLALHIWAFDDLSTIYPLFHSRGIRNYISYKNKQVDKLLEQANKTTDPVIYKAIYGKIHKLLHKELPYLFLWSLTNYSAISARVKGVIIHPFNYFHYAYRWYKK